MVFFAVNTTIYKMQIKRMIKLITAIAAWEIYVKTFNELMSVSR